MSPDPRPFDVLDQCRSAEGADGFISAATPGTCPAQGERTLLGSGMPVVITGLQGRWCSNPKRSLASWGPTHGLHLDVPHHTAAGLPVRNDHHGSLHACMHRVSSLWLQTSPTLYQLCAQSPQPRRLGPLKAAAGSTGPHVLKPIAVLRCHSGMLSQQASLPANPSAATQQELTTCR